MTKKRTTKKAARKTTKKTARRKATKKTPTKKTSPKKTSPKKTSVPQRGKAPISDETIAALKGGKLPPGVLVTPALLLALDQADHSSRGEGLVSRALKTVSTAGLRSLLEEVYRNQEYGLIFGGQIITQLAASDFDWLTAWIEQTSSPEDRAEVMRAIGHALFLILNNERGRLADPKAENVEQLNEMHATLAGSKLVKTRLGWQWIEATKRKARALKPARHRPLVPLAVVSRAMASSPRISVDWKGSDPDDVIGDLSKKYLDDFKPIDGIAALAYVVCCSEWLYTFLRHHFTSEKAAQLEQIIIAQWVWLCDLPRKLPPYFDGDPEPTTNGDAVELLIDSFWHGTVSIAKGQHDAFVNACFATQVCEYVLPARCGFKQWREAVLPRLRTGFPAGEKEPGLIRVSRRLFDTDVDPGEFDRDATCATFIGEAAQGNPYLPLTEPDSE